MIPFLIQINEAIVLRQRVLKEAETLIPYGLRVFPIIAQNDWSRHHVRYDCDSIVQLRNRQIREANTIRRARGEPILPLESPRTADHDGIFRSMFRLEKLEKFLSPDIPFVKKLRFGLSINTDGVSASILMRKVITQSEENDDRVVARIGIDPGRKLMAGAVIHSEFNANHRENIQLKSATHHHNAGYFARKRKRDKITRQLEDRLRGEREERQALAEDAGEIYDQRADLIIHERTYFVEKASLYMSNKYTRLKFDKYIQSRRAVDRFTSRLAKKRKINPGKSIVYYGDGCEGTAIIKK